MNKVKRNVIYWASAYLMREPFESIERNKHMNAFGNNLFTVNDASNPENKGSKPKGDITDVNMIISTMVSEFKGEYDSALSVLEELTNIANNIRFDFIEDLLLDSIDQDHVDAFMVDFINYVGGRVCVDYALYTKDLKGK